MLKILITSVGSLVGYNVLDSLEKRRKNLQIIGTNTIANESNVFRCNKAYLVPPTRFQPAEFSRKFLEILEIEQPDLIIPARDDDLSVLSTIRDQRPEFANSILCGSKKSVDHIIDKWLTHRFSVRHRLPFTASAIPNSDSEHSEVKDLVTEHGFPLLVKPRSGFGSNGVLIISNEDQLNYALGLENIVIQQYLSPPKEIDHLYSRFQNEGIPLFYSLEEVKYSLQTFVHRNESIGNIFCTLHKMVSGRSLKVQRINNDTLEKIALRFARALASEGWYGPLNIQCQKIHSGDFVVYELNGRFTGATSARYHLGFDEVGNTLNTLFGIRLKSSNKYQLSESRQVTRYITTLPIPDEAVSILREKGVWQSIPTN